MPPAARPDLAAFLGAQRFGPYQWLIFVLCFLIVLLDGFDTAAIGFIAPALVQEWGIARPMLAPVLSAALFGLAVGALASGPLADRFGRKIVLLLSVLLFGGACLAPGAQLQYDVYPFGSFVTGIGLGTDYEYGTGDLWPVENYWHYWTEVDGQWQMAMFGASDRTLTDGSKDAWVFGSAAAPQAVPAPGVAAVALLAFARSRRRR